MLGMAILLRTSSASRVMALRRRHLFSEAVLTPGLSIDLPQDTYKTFSTVFVQRSASSASFLFSTEHIPRMDSYCAIMAARPFALSPVRTAFWQRVTHRGLPSCRPFLARRVLCTPTRPLQYAAILRSNLPYTDSAGKSSAVAL